MWHRIAERLRSTVAEAKERLDLVEFREWQARYQTEPWGEWVWDMRFAMLCAAVSGSKSIEPFLLDWDQTPPTLEEADAKAADVSARTVDIFEQIGQVFLARQK
jgi:hypothetical protein